MSKFRELAEQYIRGNVKKEDLPFPIPVKAIDDLEDLLEQTWWQARLELLREQEMRRLVPSPRKDTESMTGE